MKLRGQGSDGRLAANLLLIGVIAAAWLVESLWPDFYARIIPEDEPVEWATLRPST